MSMRILCLGDSLTYGFGMPRAQVWTALCAARTGAELCNRAVNGNTTGGMLSALSRELEAAAPDAVFLMGGTNDLIYGGDLAGARANMGAMVHLAAASGVQPIVGIPIRPCLPIREDWAVWADTELVRRAMEEYARWLRELCQIFRVPAIDFERELSAREYYLEDGLHPNRAGHELMGSVAAEAVDALLKKGGGRRHVLY